MITTDRIIEEMQRQLNYAKTAEDDQAVREALTAIRALCQVVLASNDKKDEPIITPRTMAISHKPQISSLEGRHLEEDDANGGSIFDF
ncbi:YwdI family protein [Sporosarcina sp. 179-K 8C2 HS]|uniref:YwdI family protein n=1 Tax=Sporosarcina sp. 179-K 8C2 HS TaxID=3142387 RepID=UPI00399F7E9F